MDLQTLGAGPSTITSGANNSEENASSAPLRPLSAVHLYSVEYPGYVKPTSVPLAIDKLGGPSQVYAAFQKNGSRPGSVLGLNLSTSDPFSHPVNVEVIPSNNLLMKVVKRKRKEKDAGGNIVGEYTTEVVGAVTKTARFRSESWSPSRIGHA